MSNHDAVAGMCRDIIAGLVCAEYDIGANRIRAEPIDRGDFIARTKKWIRLLKRSGRRNTRKNINVRQTGEQEECGNHYPFETSH